MSARQQSWVFGYVDYRKSAFEICRGILTHCPSKSTHPFAAFFRESSFYLQSITAALPGPPLRSMVISSWHAARSSQFSRRDKMMKRTHGGPKLAEITSLTDLQTNPSKAPPNPTCSRPCNGARLSFPQGDYLKTTILACTVAAAMGGLFAYQDSAAPTEREPVAMERASMDGWLKGDSAPTLSAADPDITLFHVMTQHRLDGVAAVKALYEPYAGRPLFESYQIENPKVQTAGDVAILSYQLATQNGGTTRRWNATEVYQKKKAGWRVIHSHFSTTAGTPQ